MNVQDWKLLSRCELFAGMTRAEIGDFLALSGAEKVTLGKKRICLLAGEECRHLYIVVSGRLVARMDGLSGKMVDVVRMGVGYVLAPAFLFASAGRMPVCVETETDVEMLRISRRTIRHQVDKDEKFRWNYIRVLSDMASFLADKMRFLSLFTVKEKVCCYLLSLSRAQSSATVTLDLSRQSMADSFGIQKFSLLRCLAGLVAQGAILVDGKRITIVDRGKLKP